MVFDGAADGDCHGDTLDASASLLDAIGDGVGDTEEARDDALEAEIVDDGVLVDDEEFGDG